jgi:hypothetical protein
MIMKQLTADSTHGVRRQAQHNTQPRHLPPLRHSRHARRTTGSQPRPLSSGTHQLLVALPQVAHLAQLEAGGVAPQVEGSAGAGRSRLLQVGGGLGQAL